MNLAITGFGWLLAEPVHKEVGIPFIVVLAGQDVMTTDMAEALYEAGCDDAHPWSSEGVAAVTFDREADRLETAIRSAVADVQKAGYAVKRVEIENDSPLLTG